MNDIYKVTNGSIHHNTLYTDYKVEVAALNLMKFYDDVDQVFLLRLGNNNRSFHKDIDNISSQIYELSELIVSISSYREGIYDYLPEGLFHPPSLGNHHIGVDNVIFQMRAQRKIELNARKFFQPFELECFFLELNALTKENEFDILDRSGLLLNTVKKIWPLLNTLDTATAKVFVYLLPFFHMVRGNKRWLEKCLMAFLEIPVSISFTSNYVNDVRAASDQISLSNFQLGISMVLSGKHMDGERNWVFHYGPISYNDISKYVPYSNLRKLLQIIYEYCLPEMVEVEEHFVVEKSNMSFLLDKHQDTNRLGYSTFL